MKRVIKQPILCFFVVLGLLHVAASANAEAKLQFNRQTDLLLLQYDSKPDPDDIHAIAAAGSILAHPDFQNINYYAVSGAYGKQNGKFMHSPDLFTLAFGKKNTKWTDRHTDNAGSVSRLKEKTKAIIQAGGRVWVAEAGQSDVTADWMAALLKDGVAADTIKNKVIVVQHSQWNENQTTEQALAYVKANAWYVELDDGNAPYGITEWGDRSQYSTPGYQNKNKTSLPAAKASSIPKINALWNKADDVILRYYPGGYTEEWSSIHHGGVDFSDTVEIWFILDMLGLHTIDDFWQAFIVDQTYVPITSKSALKEIN